MNEQHYQPYELWSKLVGKSRRKPLPSSKLCLDLRLRVSTPPLAADCQYSDPDPRASMTVLTYPRPSGALKCGPKLWVSLDEQHYRPFEMWSKVVGKSG